MYLNKAFIFGNLTRDPELRSMPSGMNVANFNVATNRKFKDRDGKVQEQTDFHNIVVFGKQADSVAQYLKKGASVFVEGRLQTRSWDKDGQKQYRTEVVADRVQFGPRSQGSAPREKTQKEVHEEANRDLDRALDSTSQKNGGIDYPKEEINPDDIPF
ncbi:MAG TPA: single-stranded DNA-binding protein [Acidobacteriaceae bacterium]|nr:single-stranded DNA-binding protein [Acidobacteriaceae bacterium]